MLHLRTGPVEESVSEVVFPGRLEKKVSNMLMKIRISCQLNLFFLKLGLGRGIFR